MKRAMRVQAVGKRLTLITAAFMLAVSTLTASLPFILSEKASAVADTYVESFETGSSSWTNSTIVSDNADAGVVSIQGSHYARVSSGAFTRWGGSYRSEFPAGGYSTSLDLYLKMDTASNGAKEQVDYSSAINNQAGTHRRDFIFHIGTNPAVNGQWFVSASNNSPGNPLAAGNAAISQDGWYTLTHDFKNVNGVLAVTLSVTQKSTGTVLGSWTLSDPSDLISSVVGGNRYGWFTGNPFTIPYVAIDNAKLSIPTLPVKNLATNESFYTIKDALDDAHTTSGHVIEVTGDHTVTTNTVIDKDVTIRGVNGAKILTTGTNQLFTITANGATIENLTFTKTDKTPAQIFVGIQASDVTIANNTFVGQFIPPNDGGTVRALVVSGGANNVLIKDNSFSNLRQPAYINNLSSGTISNNYLTQTRGWVIEKASNFQLSGNTWGANMDDIKRVDVAIIPGSNPTTTANNYTCRIAALVAANNGAVIEDQAPASLLTCPNTSPTVTFNGSTPANGDWVRGTVNANVVATDDYGMGSYYVRYWKNAFEIANGGTLAHGCQSAPGAFLLGTLVNTACSFNTAGLVDGTKLVLSAQFLDGHNAWGSSQRTYYVDNTPPTVTVKTDSTSSVDGTVGTNPYSRVSFKLHDAAGNLKEVILNDHVYERSGTWNDLNWENITKSHLNQGTNTIVVRDKAGNESKLSFVYDTIAPDAPVLTVGGITSGASTNQPNITASWNKPSEDTVKYEYRYWNEVATSPWSVSNPWTVEVTGESRVGSFTEGEGKHFIQVRAFDALNQASPWSNIFEITYDTTAPTIQILNYSVAGRVITPNATNNDSSARLKWTQTAGNVNGVTVSNDEVLRPNFTVIADGTYEFELTATDAAGNRTVRKLIFTYITPAPVAPTGAQPSAPALQIEEVVQNQAVTPAIIGPAAQRALGANTGDEDATDGAQEVKGTSTEKTLASAIDANNTNGSAMGLAWYWWLLIVAAVSLLGWWITAAVRNREQS